MLYKSFYNGPEKKKKNGFDTNVCEFELFLTTPHIYIYNVWVYNDVWCVIYILFTN